MILRLVPLALSDGHTNFLGSVLGPLSTVFMRASRGPLRKVEQGNQMVYLQHVRGF
jgi:hypothetical protein